MPPENLTITDIARACHEANMSVCVSLGDESQPAWDDAPDWQKQSAINGVIFHLKNPGAGPAGTHENWMREKLDAGWTYGPVKNVDAKTHPCLVPYNELPEEQQNKDRVFISVVTDLKRYLIPDAITAHLAEASATPDPEPALT